MSLVIVAACSSPAPERRAAPDRSESGSAGGGESATTAPVPPVTPPGATDSGTYNAPLLSEEEVAERLAGLGGQLAIGNGPELAVARPDGGALRIIGVDGEAATQPTWSRGGDALAWSSASAGRQVVLVQRFDDGGRLDDIPEVSEAEGFPVFYLQWDGSDERLAYLRGAAQGGQVEFGLLEPGRAARPIDRGAPFYVAWAPDSARLLAHVDDRDLELYDAGPILGPDDTDGSDDTEPGEPAEPEEPAEPAEPAEPEGSDDPELLLEGEGGYAAAAWVDAERALVVADGTLALIAVADGAIEVVEPVDGPIAFVLSPDRRRVAYRALSQPGEEIVEASSRRTGGDGARPVTEDETPAEEDGLIVVDLETGDREVVTAEEAVAWEWSPDGSRLAWLSVEAQQRVIGQWHFWSVDGTDLPTASTPEHGLTRVYATSYLPFFSQYAFSVTGWAPDSSAYAFAGRVGRQPGVWIQLVDGAAAPRLVSGGDFVTWGPGATPDDRSGTSAA